MLPGLQELCLQLTCAGNKNKIFHHSYRILKLVKLQNSVAICCEIRKIYSPAKFANLLLHLYYAQERSAKPTSTFETKVFFVS